MESTNVYVTLTNRWAQFQGYYPEELSKFFSYKKPGYYFSPAYRQFKADGTRAWDGATKMIRYRRLGAGLFLAMRKECEAALGITFEIVSNRSLPEFHDADRKTERRHQNEAVDAMIKHSRCGGIILSATGTGKTFEAAEYFKQLIGYGVFIVDELTLLEQTREELAQVMGEKIGIVGKSEFNPRRITVATIQTLHLHRNDRTFRKWKRKLVAGFVDELHLALNKRNLGTLGAIPFKALFGLTATLQLGNKGVRMRAYAMCGPVIHTYPLDEGTKEGFLTPGIVLGVDIHKDETSDQERMKYADAYTQIIVKSKYWNKPIRMLAREAVARGYSTIIIVQRILHVRRLTSRLKAAGISVRAVYGKKSVRLRRQAIRLLESKKVDVIVTNKVFQKGINIKRVSVIIDGTAARDPNAALQKFGRGVRKHASKKGLIYFHLAIKPIARSRFRKAGAVHRRAFRAAGIPVSLCGWTNARAMFDMAEAMLHKVLKKRSNT